MPGVILGAYTISSVAAVKLQDNTTPAYYLKLDSDSDGTALTADRTLTFDVNNADRVIDLAGNFTTQNNNIIINAVGAARTLTLNESLIIGDGNDGTLTYSGASKTLTVEDNAVVSQDYSSDASPTFATPTVTGLQASGAALLLQDDAAQNIHSFASSASGENKQNRVYGYITAGTAVRYGYSQMSDTNDEYIIGVEDNANCEGITFELPEANQEFRIRHDGVEKFSVSQSDTDLAGAAIDFGGVVFDSINESLADSGKIDLPGSSSGGFGFVVGGDDASYAYFTFTSAGVVTLVSHNNCSTTEDNDTTLNIFDSGTVIGINNELGGTYVIQGFIFYTPN